MHLYSSSHQFNYFFLQLIPLTKNSITPVDIGTPTSSFFFSFAYTTSPAAVMKLVVFFRSSKPPYNFWWSGVAEGHCAIRAGWCLLHIWRTCSVVWSSSPQGHIGKGTIFSFLCMCALSLLWPERSRAKTTLHKPQLLEHQQLASYIPYSLHLQELYLCYWCGK